MYSNHVVSTGFSCWTRKKTAVDGGSRSNPPCYYKRYRLLWLANPWPWSMTFTLNARQAEYWYFVYTYQKLRSNSSCFKRSSGNKRTDMTHRITLPASVEKSSRLLWWSTVAKCKRCRAVTAQAARMTGGECSLAKYTKLCTVWQQNVRICCELS